MLFDDFCARGRFCERAFVDGFSCPCDDRDSLAAELREVAEEVHGTRREASRAYESLSDDLADTRMDCDGCGG